MISFKSGRSVSSRTRQSNLQPINTRDEMRYFNSYNYRGGAKGGAMNLGSSRSSHSSHNGSNINSNKNCYNQLSLSVQSALLGRYMLNPYPSQRDMEDMAAVNRTRLDKVNRWFKFQRRRDINRGVVCGICRFFRAPNLMSSWSTGRNSRTLTSCSSTQYDHCAFFSRPCYKFFFHSSDDSSPTWSPSPSSSEQFDLQLIPTPEEVKRSAYHCHRRHHSMRIKAEEIQLDVNNNIIPEPDLNLKQPKDAPSEPPSIKDFNNNQINLDSPKFNYMYKPSQFGQFLIQEVYEELFPDLC